MATIFNATEISTLENEIRRDATAAATGIKDEFCKWWPSAQAALEALLKIITNPIAKVVLNTVLAIGNAAQSAICPKG